VLDAIIKFLTNKTLTISKTFSWTGYLKPMGNYRYFTDEELKGLDKELCAMLDQARDKAGVPFVITSGLRTASANDALAGSVSDSAHLSGLAVDLAVNGDDHTLNRMMYGLTVAGFDRIGLYFRIQGSKLIPAHVHVDISRVLPPQVTWSNI
jgi:zinc D-Ala-D-Ala carboxypeptidase